MLQSKKIDFEGQNIYIGIDVHLKSWHATLLTDFGYKRKHSQVASASVLFEHLTTHYPGGRYQAIYKSGFTGFSIYYSLASYGIPCVIAHAADVPTGQNESVMETDAVDSEKLAHVLRENRLRNTVHVPFREVLDHRGMVRFRKLLRSSWQVTRHVSSTCFTATAFHFPNASPAEGHTGPAVSCSGSTKMSACSRLPGKRSICC